MTKKTSSQQYKYLIILALHQGFIDKKTVAQCQAVAEKAEDKIKAIITIFKKNGLSDQKCRHILELYKIFMVRQTNLRFGSLASTFMFIEEREVIAALEKQKEISKKKGERKKIGQILIEAGNLTEKQRDLILLKQQRDFSIKIMRDTAKIDALKKKRIEENSVAQALGDPSVTTADNKASSIRADQEPSKRDKQNAIHQPMSEFPLKEIVLKIQNDALKAFLFKPEMIKGNNLPDVTEILDFLKEKGVFIGIADEESIKKFLTPAYPRNTLFGVAQGKPANESQDASIEYFFSEHFLTAGTMQKNGAMDFKDRGLVPIIKEGTVLAIKTPARTGDNGTNIYGEEIFSEIAMDLDMSCGDGAAFSEDQLEIHATKNGFPKKDITGCVSVVQEYTIDGDVDYRTGHIEFDGNITISGTIKPGFKVSGNMVTADSIEGGIVASEGDVIIAKGILDAQVCSRGNISAAFVHHSEIICMKDIGVNQEILDSKIVSDGTITVSRGKVLSSQITSKEGVFLQHVGTTAAKASIITAGISDYAQMEVDRVNTLIKKRQEILDLKYSDKKNLEKGKADFQSQIMDTETIKNKSLAMIKDLEDSAQEEDSPIKQKMLENHKKHMENIDEQLREFKDQTNQIDKDLHDIKEQISYFTKAVTKHVQEVLVLKKVNKEGAAPPKIEIQGQILGGTKLCGRHSFTFVKDTMSRIRVQEVELDMADGEPQVWELSINPM
ncbi:MAG: DUF342 domain-containing protein [Desulfobacteraceae bacterium]|nr:DUF342 domain-containing protein [Desulfobacteraceae bacterium]